MARGKAATEELEKMGLSRDMIKGAQSIVQELQEMEDGAQQVREAYKNLAGRALKLEAEADEVYEQAKAAVAAGDDDKAREVSQGGSRGSQPAVSPVAPPSKLLEKRKSTQATLEKVLAQVIDARKRRDQVDQAVEVMARK